MMEEQRKQQNRRNRAFGKGVEREVAKLVGGQRVPASGAIKHGPYDLTGDVQVRDARGRVFVKIECKGVSEITPKGEKVFHLKKSVLEKAFREAENVDQIGVVWIHWKNEAYGIEDYVILESRHFLRLLEYAKLGAKVEEYGDDGSTRDST